MLAHPSTLVTIYDVAGIFNSAFTQAMTPKNIISAFKVTGIILFSRGIFDNEDFLTSSVMDRPAPFQQVASTSASNTNVDCVPFQNQVANTIISRIDVDLRSLQQTANICFKHKCRFVSLTYRCNNNSHNSNERRWE